jgi:hypothetical protein
MRVVKNARSRPANGTTSTRTIGARSAGAERRSIATDQVKRDGSGDGRSEELVDARRYDARAGEGWNRNGRRDVGKRRESNGPRGVNAMTLTRAGLTTVVGTLLVGTRTHAVGSAVGRMGWAIRLRRRASRSDSDSSRHGHSRRLSGLHLQPDH